MFYTLSTQAAIVYRIKCRPWIAFTLMAWEKPRTCCISVRAVRKKTSVTWICKKIPRNIRFCYIIFIINKSLNIINFLWFYPSTECQIYITCKNNISMSIFHSMQFFDYILDISTWNLKYECTTIIWLLKKLEWRENSCLNKRLKNL